MTITHELIQGTPEWCQFRLVHNGASEAAAMLGLSAKVKRNELLHMKHTGIAKEFTDWVQANILDYGHEVEALARPHVEEDISDDLYPVTCSDGDLSASCDGLTLCEEIAFEHKQWNEALAASVRAGILPDEYMPQCQQIMMVTPAKKVIFVVSDGTREKREVMDVLPDLNWQMGIRAGWDQFNKDLIDYVPRELVEKPQAEAIMQLPALIVQIKGEVSTSNLPAFKAAADKFIAGIKTDLQTDQDFADAEKTVKFCKDAEENLEATKVSAIAQTSSIDELMKTIDYISEQLRGKRLMLAKLVGTQKDVIKANILNEGKLKFADHVAALELEIKPIRLVYVQPDFAGAMKGKRTLASLHEAVDTTLAAAKIATDATAKDIRAKLAWCKESAKDYGFLFMDLQQIIGKAEDDFKLVVTTRIADHKIAEAKKAQDAIEAADKVRKAKEDAEAAQKVKDDLAADQKKIADAAKPVEQPAKVIETVEQLHTFIEQKNARHAATNAIHSDAVNHGVGMGKITVDEQGEVSVLHIPLTLPEYHPTADEAVDILAAAWQMSRREVAKHLRSMNFGDIT